jgi:hypothetical protein
VVCFEVACGLLWEPECPCAENVLVDVISTQNTRGGLRRSLPAGYRR